MKIVKVCSSQGSLGKNPGCEKCSDFILNELNKSDLIIDEIKVNINNIDETNKNIEKASGDIFLGGDHSITYSLFKGFAKKNEDFVRKLVDEGILDKKNLVYVGVRKSGKSEVEFLRDVKTIDVKKVHENIEKVKEELINFFKKFKKFYLSIDIDVLDPKFCPGTGYLEPNGLDIKELIYLISKIKRLKNLKRIDLVEVNPLKDIDNITVKNAAKILSELL